MIAVLIWSGLVSPVSGGEGVTVAPYDRAVLSEIARDVLRRGATGPSLSAPELAAPAADLPAETVVGSTADPVPPVADSAPVREGITVPIPPGTSAPRKAPPRSATTSYQSNSWRQRADTGRALSFSSGVLAPSSGLDPALKAHADGLRAQGRQFVYGFLLLRAPSSDALEKKLAGLGVELLGPHDDHQKARLPIGSLHAIAALPDVEWIGVSSPKQKQSLELTALRGSEAKAAVVDSETPIPIVINLFDGDEGGNFRRELEAAGAALGSYDTGLQSYHAVATGPVIERIVALDFVLFVELIGLGSTHHDQSTPLIDADMIRPGTISYGVTRFSGAPIPVGVMDTGFMIGTYGHDDLGIKVACGLNFTMEPGVYFDQNGHGTHVLGTVSGTGSADSRYKGVAPGVGLPGPGGLRLAKIWDKTGHGQMSWMRDAMNWMAQAYECEMPAPMVINISGGQGGTALTGTDEWARKLDERVWLNAQLYVVSAGNDGPSSQTIGTPAVAKNALTVGNVSDHGYNFVGDIVNGSSRGPTGDGRMKPNVVAPGFKVTSAKADVDSTSKYAEYYGTSMSAPHVTGLAATLMEHYPAFQFKPALVRAHLMSTALAHDDVAAKSDAYGTGRVSGYVAHWDHPNTDGWSTYRYWGTVNSLGYAYGDIVVPVGTKRLVVAMTWDEPPASAGASRAVMYDVDLWLDRVNCTDPIGACGQYSSVSSVDNVEYVVVENPPAGTYRMKVVPSNVTGITLPWGMTATIIRGDPTPQMAAYMTISPNPTVGTPFGVTVHVSTPAYVVSGIEVEPSIALAPGVTPLYSETTRLDGVTMLYSDGLRAMVLGNAVPMLGRSATWYFRADSSGSRTFIVRATSENGGEVIMQQLIYVAPTMSSADLMVTAMTTNPPAPVRAPGTTFSVTDTVRNVGLAPSGPSTTRYYLSLDAMKSADDVRLTGSHSVGGLDPGESRSATATVTIPAGTPVSSYFLLACADDANTVGETNEGNNCTATAGATVTVARPDLSATTLTTNPPAPTRAPGATFSVTDSVRNLGPAASGSSTTRYYLSLDAVKGAGDTLLTGSRGVPGLAAGVTHSGTVTVTIPPATPLNSYFLLACADDLNAVVETDEGNNCVATATATVTVTRADLVESAVSGPPATQKRGTSFPMTDTVQNLGAVPSGASTTRHYLSLDAVKSANDILLTGSRSVPAVAAGATQSGTVTVTIPVATAPNTYYVLTCADSTNAVIETDETNNCRASSTTVTVTP
jgi:subtilisin family serine protease